MNSGPIWITTSGFLSTITELVSTSTSVAASGTNVTYKLISGQLPQGMQVVSTGTISGTPAAVINKTNYRFVIRATSAEGIADREFSLSVIGSQPPVWNTSSGYSSNLDYNTSTAYLHLGPSGEKFTLNKQYVYYQFTATAYLAPENTEITYYIPENGGELPPGLTLSKDGVLSGIINDVLIFDAQIDDTGGYDDEGYGNFSYDHGLIAYTSVGVPKIYQFKVTASDRVRSSDRNFKILIVSPEMVRDPSKIPITLEPGLISTITNYIPLPQFIKGNNLGVARAQNNETFDVSVYDGYPSLGLVTYNTIIGPDKFSNLPDFLQIESILGKIYGYIPYQPAYSENYKITVSAEKISANNIVTATNTFTLTIKGDVESTIEWVSSSTLGIIYEGITSEVAVIARQIDSEYNIKYSQISGTIPPGLNLETDGSLSGAVSYGNTGTYVFSVRAEDVHELSAIEKEFTLEVKSYNTNTYTKIWMKPFLHKNKKDEYREFLTNEFTFPQSSIYRYFDNNFGIQYDMKMILEFGIQQLDLGDYTVALRENFYRRSFTFGDIKSAVAKTSSGTTLYEVVYVDIVDSMQQENPLSQLGSVSPVLYHVGEIYYPSSIENMRSQFAHLTIDDNSLISIDEFYLPRFMRTAQQGDYRPAGYMSVMPICYVNPGESQKIISRIKLSGFDFKSFHFDIDRLIIEKSKNYDGAKYLLLPRRNIGDSIDSDRIIYTFNGTPLETDQNVSITRE